MIKFHATEKAIARINELIKNEKNKNALRVSVDGGGCSGFMYNYELIQNPSSKDNILELGGVKIAIDPVSITLLEDCTLNFIEELGASYFEVKNPKATARCGCGNSFSV